MVEGLLEAERQYLARLLEAIQRCAYFLHASDGKIAWPLAGGTLVIRKKDGELFESLSAINERFAKLQDTLGAAMRHASMLMGEHTDNFLKVLAFHEKIGVIDSISSWQLCRTARNLAAHDYETEYAEIAEHFNALHDLQPLLYQAAGRLLATCATNLGVYPPSEDFTQEFSDIVGPFKE
ncbi:MAG: hypothetical protein KDI64_22550 [Candidatus Accumulibacter sp.]|nr:hypothetical protein [Accumulibacter sp.]